MSERVRWGGSLYGNLDEGPDDPPQHIERVVRVRDTRPLYRYSCPHCPAVLQAPQAEPIEAGDLRYLVADHFRETHPDLLRRHPAPEIRKEIDAAGVVNLVLGKDGTYK